MNRYVALVPIAILILSGTGIVSQAFAVTTITIETDNDVYDHASTITLTGTVNPVDLNEVPVTITIVSPKGGIADIDQISVNSDGSFLATFETSSFLMKDDGIYQFRVNYGGAMITTSIELTNAVGTSESGTSESGTAVSGTIAKQAYGTLYEISTGHIEYDMTCNGDPAFFANSDDDSIIIFIEPKNDGVLTITLHEELIKPFEDGTFAVIVNNQEMQDYTQIGNTLTIPCLMGTEKIEIHGSWAIPEFGVIAAMILAVAIVSIIVVTAKTKLSIVPRY